MGSAAVPLHGFIACMVNAMFDWILFRMDSIAKANGAPCTCAGVVLF